MQSLSNLRQKIQNHPKISIVVLIAILIIIIAIPLTNKTPINESPDETTTEMKYDPISHEMYHEDAEDNDSTREPEIDLVDAPDFQLLGFNAISTTTRGDLYEQFLQDLNKYTQKTFTNEKIVYISLYEDSLTYDNDSPDYFSMNFTIYFNGSHPTNVTFETYPKVSTKFTPAS